jgi:hypothetical protein
LIQLLELHSQFAAMSPHSQGVSTGRMIEKPVTKCDAGVQTEVHPIESNIVKSYEWNEWELRRKAIKLVSDKIILLINSTSKQMIFVIVMVG